MSTATRMREAATVLRERASHATPGPWLEVLDLDFDGNVNEARVVAGTAMVTEDGESPYEFLSADRIAVEDAEHLDPASANQFGLNYTYIATMHPAVGLALADWLEDLAGQHGAIEGYQLPSDHPAMRVADVILGSEVK